MQDSSTAPLNRPISPADRRRIYAEADRRHRVDHPSFLANLPIEMIFSFGCFTAMLFILQFGGMGAAALIGLGGLYALLRLQIALNILWSRLFILLIPLLALLSTLWSQDQGATMRYSIQYFITVVIAMFLAGAPRQRAIIQGAFLAFAVYAVISLLFGQSVRMGSMGATAFSGLSTSKNLLADIASSGLLISLGVILVSGRKGLVVWGPLGLLFAGLNAYMLVESRSAGALVAAGIGVMAFAVLAALQAVSVGMRSFCTGILVLSLATFAAFSRDISALAIQIAQDVFDKDPTLTGRTYLWERAFDLIHERPVLGLGFNAFWLQGNPEAEGLWRYGGITEASGFNFHNTGIEILIHLGWVGLAVCVGVALISFCLLFYRYVTRPTSEMAVWCAILLYEAVRMPLETLGFLQFHFGTVLIFAALGAAVPPTRLVSRSGAPEQQPETIVQESPVTMRPRHRAIGA